jgi:hypothetical protein
MTLIIHTSVESALKSFEKDLAPTLIFKGAIFDDTETKKFAMKLQQGIFLRKFVLSNCTINAQQLGWLLEMLEKIPLREIRIILCKVDDAGAIHVANLLSKNKSVKALVLSSNEIGDEGAKALASALSKADVDTVLLADNRIGNGGAQALLETVTIAKHVKELFLPQNRITDHSLVEKIDAACIANDPSSTKEHELTDAEVEASRSGMFGSSAASIGSGKDNENNNSTGTVSTKLRYKGVRGMIEHLERHETHKAEEINTAVLRSECQRVLALGIRARDPDTLEKVLTSASPAVVLGAIRAHFKLQKNSIIPPSMFNSVVAESRAKKDDEEFADYLGTVFAKLSTESSTSADVAAFGDLCEFLHKVTHTSFDDIAVVWGPLVLRNIDDTLLQVKEMEVSKRIMTICLEYYLKVFKYRHGKKQ